MRVRVVLHQVEPVIVSSMVLMQVPNRLIHQPDGPVVAVGNHSHAVRQLGTAQAGEEKGAVSVMGHSTVHGHCQRVEGGTGSQHSHQEALSDSQLCVNVTRPEWERRCSYSLFNCHKTTQETLHMYSMANRNACGLSQCRKRH